MSTHDFDCASVDMKSYLRAYTPTSMEDEVGHFDLDTKEY
jgi:nitrate reductase (NAD(P)H)